jgi:uncharacterized peroxidase-related enzyme
MTALPLIDDDSAEGTAKDLLAAVQAGLGVTPNMTRAMANSPALLQGYLGLAGALDTGVLPGSTRELLALAVAQRNTCEYCLSAHAYLAEHVAHLDADTIASGRKADHVDPKTAAILTLAVAVVDNRGDLGADDLESARTAGVSDEEIAETIGHVGLNVLTNYFNKAADVPIDFPHVAA